MNDIDWFCNFFGLQLMYYQKMFMYLKCHREICEIREIISSIRKEVNDE